ncbi:MAG: enoyl-CoA hydratase-related protein, partial [Acetobacteraceae bacterium]
DIGAKGPDADDWRSDPTKAHAHLQPQLEFEMAPWLMTKPVIASVQGHVLGGGCELVMLCDLTIAAGNATFGEPEVRFSAVGPAIVMPMIIGYKRARELLYFGDQIDAQTALDIGMINRIVPLAELRTASLTYAKRLSLISPEALYATKRAVNRVADAAGFRTALYSGLDAVGPLYATATELGTQFREIARTEGPRSGGDRLSSRDRADDAQRRIRVVFAGRRLGYGRGLGRSRSAALPEQLARHQYDFDERSALVEVIA